MSGTSGSSGLGSVSIEQIESSTEPPEDDVSKAAAITQHRKADFISDVVIVVKRAQLTLRNGQCGRPLVTQDVQANRAVCIDIGMINLSRKRDLGWLEGVIRGEHNREEEDATRVRRVSLSTSMEHQRIQRKIACQHVGFQMMSSEQERDGCDKGGGQARGWWPMLMMLACEMETKKDALTGPMMVACQLNMFSAEGPALHEEGGSRPRSINSYEEDINRPSM